MQGELYAGSLSSLQTHNKHELYIQITNHMKVFIEELTVPQLINNVSRILWNPKVH